MLIVNRWVLYAHSLLSAQMASLLAIASLENYQYNSLITCYLRWMLDSQL